MMDEKSDLSNKFSLYITGEHKLLSDLEKTQINELLSNFLGRFDETFKEGVLFVDIKNHKGHYNKGKFRGQNLAYIHVRFSTDKGVFMAHKENWGAKSALHDSLIILTNQIRDEMHRRIGKEKAHNFISERKMVET